VRGREHPEKHEISKFGKINQNWPNWQFYGVLVPWRRKIYIVRRYEFALPGVPTPLFILLLSHKPLFHAVFGMLLYSDVAVPASLLSLLACPA
jgi:hypothetical protein